MKKSLFRSLALSCIALPAIAFAQTSEQGASKMRDQEYCYGLATMANFAVLQRNAGKTLDEQMERRKRTLGADTPEYKLVADIARQVYEKNVTNPLTAAGDAHKSCLNAKGIGAGVTEKAIQLCPTLGMMVADIALARTRGASMEQVTAFLGDRYGTLPKTYQGGVEKIAARYSAGGKPESGFQDYAMCMASGTR